MTTVPRPLLRAVARSLDTPEELAPHLSAVFARLSALGAMPARSAAMLARHIPASRRRRPTILDAACGKGAVSIALAGRLDCDITAFDAYPPFIDAARAAAQRAGVADHCHFEISTAEAFLKRAHAYDGAMMLNLWHSRKAARALRRVVRPNGVYLIDDATLDPSHPGAPDFDSMPTLEEVNRFINHLGDEILEVFRPTPSAIERQNAALFRRIKAATHTLVGTNPRLRPAVRELLRRQTEANGLLRGPLRPTLWVVRRGRN